MNNTILQVKKEDCYGCGACYNKCPVNAISMEYDDEGFLFPKINDSCIECGQCSAVCPAIHPIALHETPESYAVWAEDEVRLKSSSGGMFSLLADYILEQGGIICGAAYTEDFQSVYHTWAENKQELSPLRGSKYVQSDTNLTYQEAKSYLEAGKMVLYSGCPCQIAGLYNYLGKTYDNLYTADLVCHGANSLKAYQSFIKEFSGGKEIEKVEFRDKKFYTWSTPTVIYLKNGDVKKAAWNESTWNQGFLEGVINRKNCQHCPFARAERIADITMADCWQVHRYNPAYDDRKGTSLVLINSEHGKNIFNKIRSNMKLCEPVPLDLVRQFNGQLNKPATMHPSRKFFFSHLDQFGYHKALWYGRGRRFDVGIVGWWFASNYGSSLTYYALGTVLEKMGKQVLMLPIAKTNGTPFEPEIQFTIDFISKYFRIGNKRTYDKMYEYNQFCDSFMLGSDQLWVGSYIDLVGYTFFLDFVDKNKKKIAFSTSFGKNDFQASDKECATASDYLKRFDAISVREKSGIDICKKRFDVNADQVFDPVFLCDRTDYDKLADSVDKKIKSKYLLCYILDPTSEKEAAARKIAEHENLKILTIIGMKEYKYASTKWCTGEVLPRITSEEFLFYIKHCSYLLTDSHHGTCFGIIYHKPYSAVVNVNRGATRFETVANALNLRSRLFYDANEICSSERAFETINYSDVDIRLSAETERAFLWLKNALECPAKQNEDTINTALADEGRKIAVMANRISTLERKISELNDTLNINNNIQSKSMSKKKVNLKLFIKNSVKKNQFLVRIYRKTNSLLRNFKN